MLSDENSQTNYVINDVYYNGVSIRTDRAALNPRDLKSTPPRICVTLRRYSSLELQILGVF